MGKAIKALIGCIFIAVFMLCGCETVITVDENDITGDVVTVTPYVTVASSDVRVTDVTNASVERHEIVTMVTTVKATSDSETSEVSTTKATGLVVGSQTTTTTVDVPLSEQGAPYYVKYGDTLSAIASRCLNEQGVAISVEGLLQFNHWDDDIMCEGDILYIPWGYKLQDIDSSETQEAKEQYVYGEYQNTSYTAPWSSFENMIAACDALNGMRIPAKSTFSWLNNVEPIASQNYVLAECYDGYTVIDGYGGGICMVSSTLKVAAYNAGLSIVQSSPHTMPVSYVDRETEDWQFLEAAVDSTYGTDLVIYNPYDCAVTITAWVSYPSVFIQIN